MAGGVDGLTVTHPTHTMTPVKLLVTARLATEAAAYVVRTDFATDPAARRLLGRVQADTVDEDLVRAQIADLSLRILTERIDPDGADADAWYDLFAESRAEHGDGAAAWTVLIGAMLQDPAVLYY
jgi:hypothetical protein